ncbi:MAG TPA: tetratricopeptide repeat protein [bacterium]|nr:tetratricopeptide repeat protein [bacterium]HQO33602.1 tetratricopeptide repeat protein [bacterium]HQP97211.1 tetratricopeptide repeat protein [bacterium]
MADTETTTDIALTRSPYRVLGVDRRATEDEIKAAYFALVKKYSPEYHPDEFIEVRTAYDILKDPASRARENISILAPSPRLRYSDYPDYPEQPLSHFKLNQQLSAILGERNLDQLPDEERAKAIIILRGRSLYLADHGRWEEAEEDFKTILRYKSGDSETVHNRRAMRWKQGYDLAFAGRWEEAVEIWLPLAEEMRDGDLFQNLAIAYGKMEDGENQDKWWKKALEAWHGVLRQYPDDEYYKALILAAHKQSGGRFLGGATSASEDFVGGSGKDLGYACMQRGNWAQAVRAFESCFDECRDDVDFLCQLGWAYLNTSRINEAFHMWNRALKVSGGKEQVKDHIIRGNITIGKRLRGQNIHQQALAHFKNALRFDPANLDVRGLIAETYFEMRKFPAALKEYEKILELDPRNKVAKQGLREAKRLGNLR